MPQPWEKPQTSHGNPWDKPEETTAAPTPSMTANPRGEGTYPMWDTAGKMSAVPYSQVPQARAGGYKFDTNKMQQRGMTPQDAYVKDAEYAGNKDQPSSASLYWKVLTDPVGSGAPQGVYGGIRQVGGQAIKTMAQPILHPIDTLAGIRKIASDTAIYGLQATATDIVEPMAQQYMQDKEQGGNALALENLVGQLAGNVEGGRMMGAGIKAAAPKVMQAGSAIRDAAIGDPDVAAVRAAEMPKKRALGFKADVQAARPYLAGSQSVEDVQKTAGIGGTARDEIYKPISDFLAEHGDRVVQGPDGPTTLRDLEGERGQVSAQLRQLRAGGPEGIALATQKGLNEADLLARQSAIEGAMDPHLMGAGIDSPLIRQTYGQVARVGDQFAGRWTPAEKPTPYGFGRLMNVAPLKPRTWLGQPAQGVRDLIAGRPLWSGNAGDVGVGEAFRTGGPKPDFRAPASSQPPFMQPPRQLEANVPGNADYGDIDVGSMAGIPHPGPQVGMAPPSRLALPSSTGAGEAQPMIRYAKPYVEPFDPHFEPVDLNEYRGQLKKYKEQ